MRQGVRCGHGGGSFRRAPAGAHGPRRNPPLRLTGFVGRERELTEGLGLSRHRAKTVWGLLTRSAATVLARTPLRLAVI